MASVYGTRKNKQNLEKHQRLQNTESRKGLQQNHVENTNSYKNNSQKLDMRMRLWHASVNGNTKQICEQHQLLQSVPITTDVVSSNLDQGEVCNIMW